MFAEVVYLTCFDGMHMPLEMAFADQTSNVKLFRIAPIPNSYWLTFKDWVNTRSRMRNTDRFYNSGATSIDSPSWTYQECKLEAHLWLSQLHDCIPPDTRLIVRGPSQFRFFHHLCGYMNVHRIVWETGASLVNVSHPHCRKLFEYPCPAIEVATMAYHLKQYCIPPDTRLIVRSPS